MMTENRSGMVPVEGADATRVAAPTSPTTNDVQNPEDLPAESAEGKSSPTSTNAAADSPETTPAGESETQAASETTSPAAESGNKQWYVVKVLSGREESVKEAIERRVKIEGLEPYFGQIIVPMEREVVTIQSGKRKGQKTIRKKKKFPGYIMAHVELNERILYLFRETSGVGDFVGASQHRKPIPMSEREVAAMLRDQEDVMGLLPTGKEAKKRGAPAKLPFSVCDKVRVREGIFSGQEGEIKEIREPKDDSETHRISVELTVFGRPTRVQLEHWQIESV